MGPLSSIGDSVFKATFMTIFAAIGAALALDGNMAAPSCLLSPRAAQRVFPGGCSSNTAMSWAPIWW